MRLRPRRRRTTILDIPLIGDDIFPSGVVRMDIGRGGATAAKWQEENLELTTDFFAVRPDSRLGGRNGYGSS